MRAYMQTRDAFQKPVTRWKVPDNSERGLEDRVSPPDTEEEEADYRTVSLTEAQRPA